VQITDGFLDHSEQSSQDTHQKPYRLPIPSRIFCSGQVLEAYSRRYRASGASDGGAETQQNEEGEISCTRVSEREWGELERMEVPLHRSRGGGGSGRHPDLIWDAVERT
jgi:hypothetical protein